jgi:hypothetical protein
MIMGRATDFLFDSPREQSEVEAKATEILALLAGYGLKAVIKPFVVFPNTPPRSDQQAA